VVQSLIYNHSMDKLIRPFIAFFPFVFLPYSHPATEPIAVMCSEAVPWRCHRRMIADYLILVEGISVFNIIDSKQQPEPHQLTSFAHLNDSKTTIIYPEKIDK
jgi:uncharacterized protein (DUF488 family)